MQQERTEVSWGCTLGLDLEFGRGRGNCIITISKYWRGWSTAEAAVLSLKAELGPMDETFWQAYFGKKQFSTVHKRGWLLDKALRCASLEAFKKELTNPSLCFHYAFCHYTREISKTQER